MNRAATQPGASPARRELRARCLAARGALTATSRREASHAACRHLHASPLWWRARRVAFYWARAPELELTELLGAALRERKRCYLPVMRHGGRLAFMPYDGLDALHRNDYGVMEPRWSPRRVLPAARLDLVCVPLVGFDRAGTRLGLGGGFYDRSLAFLLRSDGCRGPRLVGTGFACQEQPYVPRQPWDVPLDYVATERGLIACTQPRNRS